MDLIEALILGIVQGLTEWLPVSSSGHLVIAQEMLGLATEENLLFDLVVHLGTVLAVCVYFRKELAGIVKALVTPRSRRGEREEALRKLGLLALLATVPVAVIGVLLTDYIDEIFSITLVGAALLLNAAILFTAERTARKDTKKAAGTLDAVVVGLFQAVSILPGVSRSGSTLSGGMFRGIEKEAAATFAFIISIPALLGATVYGFATLDSYDADAATMLVGAGAAFLVGIVSIDYLLKAVRTSRLWMFSAYCAVLGAAVLLLTI